MEDKIKASLENIRHVLQADGGDVEFVSYADDGTVSVKLTGACGSCPMAQMTIKMTVEQYLKQQLPEISAVVGV